MADTSETPRAPRTERPAPTRPPDNRRKSRLIVLAVVVVVAVAVAAAVFLLNDTDEVHEPLASPEGWDSAGYEGPEASEAKTESIDLADKKGEGQVDVIVHAAKGTCWQGYIGSEAINDCGRVIFNVTNAPAALGLNVKSIESTRAFLGVAVVDNEGATIERDDTRKPFGSIVLSVTSTL